MRTLTRLLTVLAISKILLCHSFALDKTFSFTPFSSLPPEELQGGSIKSESISTSSIPSAMGAQTIFFIPAAPTTVAHKLLSWDASSYKDLGILQHITFTLPATKASFSALSFSEDTAYNQSFIQATAKAKDLHLTPKDLNFLKSSPTKQDPQSTTEAWKQILADKASSFASGGINTIAPYQFANVNFSPTSELKKLLNNNSPIATHFSILLDSIFSGTTDPGETSLYWEKLKIDRQSALNLGITKALPSDSTWQVIDYQYYVSSNYYTSMILYQIAPATIGGKSGSIIWRADLILTPGMENAKGVERVFGAKVLIQEIRKSIEYLRRDISK